MLKNKKIFGSLFLAGLLSLCFLFVVPEVSFAAGEFISITEDAINHDVDLNELSSSLNDSLGWLGKGIIGSGLVFLRKLTAVFLTVAMDTLDLMLDNRMYSQVFFSEQSRDAINTGWTLVRDFINMFYILILLFLAIATILRVNRFSDKKLMLYVVFSALLVNFSQAITLVIIDASNLAMNFFSQQINVLGISFTTLLADGISFGDVWTNNKFFDTDGALISAFAEIVFTAIFAVTIFVLAIALIIRLVAFWVLIVLSPLAFFGLALPGTGLITMWKSWLSRLTNYAFFGPILLFFLWLSLVLITALSGSKALSTIPGINDTPVNAGDGLDGFAINFFKNTIPYVAAIYMIFYGFSISREMAAKAGGAAGALMSKGQGWMTRGGKYAAIAGTGAAGLLAYGAYKGGGAYTGAKMDKLADSDSKWRLLTKKGRKKAMDEKKAEWKGAGDEDYERGKANESYDKMKKDGLTKDEVLKNVSDKDKYTAAGAAKLAAEKGWLDKQDDYDIAKQASGKVEGMASQFDVLSKKKNLKSFINSKLAAKAKDMGYANVNDLATNNWAEAEKIISEHTAGKGVEDFADQNIDFLRDPNIQYHLASKYAGVPTAVKDAARKKATDKINDPEKLKEMLDILR